jgi:hypothetical protein
VSRDRLAEIEEYTHDPEAYLWVDPMGDIDWLIEEVLRLGKLEDGLRHEANQYVDELHEAQAEVERLREELYGSRGSSGGLCGA